ncbi:MAG: sigma-70 family RNA polymerase sigma factor, partial [Bacteroidota bacterium]
AEEIVQDAFVKAFRSMHAFRGDSQFSSWFYRIVYNTALSSVRRKEIPRIPIEDWVEKVDPALTNETSSQMDHKDRSYYIHQALESLSILDYTILSLFYFEGMSLREIAEITGKKRNYMKVLLQRARKKLYEALDESVREELRDLL